MKWFDGGFKEGDRVTDTDGRECELTVSLGTLGWIAIEVETGRKVILMFEQKK